MPPNKQNRKIWNEDLVTALRAREEMARRGGKRSAITFKQGADTIEAVRDNIYQVRWDSIASFFC